jgi:hypothetical protein
MGQTLCNASRKHTSSLLDCLALLALRVDMSLAAVLTTDSSFGLGMPEGLSRAWKGFGALDLSLGVPRYVPAADIVVRAIQKSVRGR